LLLTVVIIVCFGLIFNTYADGVVANEAIENKRLYLLLVALFAVILSVFFANTRATKSARRMGRYEIPTAGFRDASNLYCMSG